MLLFLATGPAFATSPAAVDVPTVREVLAEIGFSEADRKAILAGDTIVRDAIRISDNEIVTAAGLRFFPGAAAAVSAAYRDVLKARFRAHHARGLGGIEPYDRGDGETASAAEDGLFLPHEDDTLLFFFNSTRSNLVVRYVRRVALPIGQSITRSEVGRYLLNVRADGARRLGEGML